MGATLYVVLSGESPFPSETLTKLSAQPAHGRSGTGSDDGAGAMMFGFPKKDLEVEPTNILRDGGGVGGGAHAHGTLRTSDAGGYIYIYRDYITPGCDY